MLRVIFLTIGILSLSVLTGCGGLMPQGAQSGSPLFSMFQNGKRGGGIPNAANMPTTTRLNYAANGTIIEPGQEMTTAAEMAATDPALQAVSVTLAFVDTDVREFSRILFSEMLQRPYVIDPTVSGQVTLRSGGKVDGNAAIALAKQALQAGGNTISLSDGVYRVTNAMASGQDPTGNLKVFQLRFITADAAVTALQPMLAGRADIVLARDSQLSLRGDPETLAVVKSMIDLIDIDQFRTSSFGLFPLRNADADAVTSELASMYQGVGVGDVTLLPIKRMNAVMVIAPKRSYLDFAQKWIQRLDQGNQNERQIHTYQVQHRQAVDLATLLKEVFSEAQGDTPSADEGLSADAGGPLLSGGLKITADPASNALVVWADQAEYALVERALQRLDSPLRQVYVEATIAEVRLNEELSHGVRWFFEGGPFSASLTDTASGTIGPDNPGFNFSFQAPEAKVVLSALESQTDVKIVSSPNLTVVDRETATIQVGDQVPIVTKSIQDASSGNNVIANDVTFRDTGVILKVTPQVQDSGDVLLQIEQEVSRVLPNSTAALNSPTISQRKVSSTVLVPNGVAIVLGGMMSTNEDQSDAGLPGTKGTILDAFFGSKKQTASRSELLVIIRPVIIDDMSDLRDIVTEIAQKMPAAIRMDVQ